MPNLQNRHFSEQQHRKKEEKDMHRLPIKLRQMLQYNKLHNLQIWIRSIDHQNMRLMPPRLSSMQSRRCPYMPGM